MLISDDLIEMLDICFEYVGHLGYNHYFKEFKLEYDTQYQLWRVVFYNDSMKKEYYDFIKKTIDRIYRGLQELV